MNVRNICDLDRGTINDGLIDHTAAFDTKVSARGPV